MKVVINGVHVMFSAIESFKPEGDCLVIRTVSGAEHRIACTTETAEQMIDVITDRMAICDSL